MYIEKDYNIKIQIYRSCWIGLCVGTFEEKLLGPMKLLNLVFLKKNLIYLFWMH